MARNFGSNNNDRDTFEKAIGFFNLSIEIDRPDGSVGLYHFPTGIPLRASKPEEKELADFLKANPAMAEQVLGSMKARFVAVQPEGVARGKLRLGSLKAPAPATNG